ncbi:hypothetical protein ABW19_dt0208868 [Dactylella cylindrospora]|nr:hypothetical protein ABW19_dt0208868 [Dactylella cylindrospora]
MRSFILISVLSAAAGVLAHGSAPHRDEGEDLDWASRHMLVEHHLNNFDPSSFFTLHDFDGSHTWSPHEILRFYGINPNTGRLVDEMGTVGKEISWEKRDEIVKKVLSLADFDNDGAVTLEEFVAFWGDGGRLPDFGLGTGHHGDDEYEYEIHHYEKYHGDDDNVKDEDLNHPEDIAHFKKHDELHDEEEKWDMEARLRVIEKNIPTKFRVQRGGNN